MLHPSIFILCHILSAVPHLTANVHSSPSPTHNSHHTPCTPDSPLLPSWCARHMRHYGHEPLVTRPCNEPGCGRRAARAEDGTATHCRRHMKQHGLTPRLAICQHQGCDKVGVTWVRGL